MSQSLDEKFVHKGLLLVFITLLLDIIGVAIIVPVMPEYLSQLTGDSISKASVDGGILFMVYSTMQFLFAPLIGNLSDRFGRRPILLMSIITFAIDNFICAIAWSYSMLFIGRILAGISGASFSTCSAYLADISDDRTRTRNFGLIGIAFGVGFFLGPLIGGILGEIGPRIPFYFSACLSLINFIFAMFILPETLPLSLRRPFDIKRANPLGALLELRRYHTVLWVAAAFFLYWLAEAVWPSTLAFVAKERYGWGEFSIGLAYGVFGIGQGLVMGLLLPYMTRRFSNWQISMTGLIFALVGMVGYTFAIEGWMLYVVFLLTMPEYIAHVPMRSIASAQVPANAQGALQGALTSITSLTSIVGPLFYTSVFSYFDSEDAPFKFVGAPFATSFFVLLAATLVFAFYVQEDKKSKTTTIEINPVTKIHE
ncbi:MFS transporter [uncultured Bartonella sp.]|uniref:MFS transporter n=1 Tax=uncultured Bartonella sp. TaxID=104108 RepID=UPI002607AA87|nr:MFS transporter [uncultured Bartonella sp.]